MKTAGTVQESPSGGRAAVRSMTGFGRADASDGRRRVTVEIRCVNHRYSDINVRLPRNLFQFEELLRRLVHAEVRRGRVDVYVTVQDAPEAARAVTVNLALARGYYQALGELCRALDIEEPVRLDHLLRAPDVLAVAEDGTEPQELEALVQGACRDALVMVAGMRAGEGQALRWDLLDRLERLSGIRSRIAGLAEGLVPAWRDRLLARLTEIVPANGLDPQRVAQEVAIYADRADISEELVRLDSHVARMRETLEIPSAEPIGRRLDFICQEMLREVNTIGSKASDNEIGGLVIGAKEELERIREQVQNVE
ncbi:MAG: YicC/YloC family endoribonuclease [Bacillota bacterium]|nr:YicC/YloC family endoribonuclease [Bacillota bacterium]